MDSPLKIVVTGEVDSGKSTLIGRFLYEMGSLPQEAIEGIKNACKKLSGDFEFAYLLDSFEEERKNQLTIDTTQVFCKTKIGKGFIFIDVPGHRELLKNMLCGSSCADIALLVVDVQKSVEEQTKRHLFILKFLGIEQIIIVLNKMDLAGFKEDAFEATKEDMGRLFRKLGLQPGYFIPVSAKQGENLLRKPKTMPWFKGLSLLKALNKLNKEFKKGKRHEFYFPIQDVYSRDGERIYAGNIVSGRVKKGEVVKTLPPEEECKIKEIKVFGKIISLAKAPQSVGLVLTNHKSFQRGQVICRGKPEVTTQILAKIFCVYPLSIGERLLFKCATQQTPAKIRQINKILDIANLEINQGKANLKEADAAEVVIDTERPVVIKKFHRLDIFGRFVLQDGREIRGVGIIT